MTNTTRHRVQSQTFAKTGVGVLGAVVAATAAVTFGSAGIAQACTDDGDGITACVYVQNNTGYTVYSTGGTSTAGASLGDSATFAYAVPWGESIGFTFTMPENTSYAASTWTLTYDYETGNCPTSECWASGSASSPASFGTKTTDSESLTLGGAIHSFTSSGGKNIYVGSVAPVSSVAPVRVNYASETPSDTRGTIIVVNEKPMKIWNPRTNPLRGVAAKPTAPVSAVAAASPASSTLPAQPQSVVKTATPHRAAARR